MRISVILPVHSETESLERVVEKLTYLVGDLICEIIIVASTESPEKTLETCQALAMKYPNVRTYVQKGVGLGLAVRQGLNHAEGTHVLMIDSDGEMSPETVPEMIVKMRVENCDVVVASRWMIGGGAMGYAAQKYVFVHLFNTIFRFLYRTKIHDLSLGFKLMRVEVAKGISWEGERHEIAAETTLRPIRLGYKVGEVSTVWVRGKRRKPKNWAWTNIRYIMMAMKILEGRKTRKHVASSPVGGGC